METIIPTFYAIVLNRSLLKSFLLSFMQASDDGLLVSSLNDNKTVYATEAIKFHFILLPYYFIVTK